MKPAGSRADGKNLRSLEREARERILITETSVPALEAQLLLAKALGKSREYILTYPEKIPSPREEELFEDMVRRRERFEPMAYILGEREFYSMTFISDARALVPRPESEIIVEAAFSMFGPESRIAALDIGAGSGVIGVCLARHRPEWKITALDISEKALTLARENARLHKVEDKIEFIAADLFPPGLAKFDLIAANPPYIPSGAEDLRPDITHYEPPVSLYGGADGLDLIRKIVEGAPGRLNPGGGLILEMGHFHMKEVTGLIKKTGFFKSCRAIQDQHGIDRVIAAKG